MFSITYTPMDVKSYFKSALTPEDRDRLDAADAYYMDAGDGWHIFGQACANEHCFGCWTATVHERNTRDFALAIDRACNTEAVCHACWLKANVLPPSLITYRAKSAGAGASGGNGGSKGGKVTRRKQAGQRSNPRTSYAQQIAASHGWTLVKVGHRYYMTKEGEQARSFSNLDQVLDFVQQQAKAVA